MLDELALNYRTSVVLCTATQPALNAPDFDGGFDNVRELAPNPASLFERLARVTVVFAGTLDDETLRRRMREHSQALCIVNNRRHAQALFASIEKEDGARHLSTLMYAKHRTRVLNEVRQMLKDNQPCRLVSTSLIEAGVDIDFPYVLRAEAGLDSIAQAAGRCNRSGKNTRGGSLVEVFAPQNTEWAPPKQLEAFADKAREVMRTVNGDPLSITAIKAYFQAVYWQKGTSQLDQSGLLAMIEREGIRGFPFEIIDNEFRMIDDVQMPIIIPRDPECIELLKELQDVEKCGAIARKLQPYLIQIPQKTYGLLLNSGAIQPVKEEKYDHQFVQLVALDLYHDLYGLSLDGSMNLDAGNLCW